MDDTVLPLEVEKAAATARQLRAKNDFSTAAVAVLKAERGSPEQVNRCLLELIDARAKLTALDEQRVQDVPGC